jgi:hypothetical protein
MTNGGGKHTHSQDVNAAHVAVTIGRTPGPLMAVAPYEPLLALARSWAKKLPCASAQRRYQEEEKLRS